MSVRRTNAARFSTVIAMTLATSLLTTIPGGTFPAFADDPGSAEPVDANPIQGWDGSDPAPQSKPLPDKLSDLPDGSGSTDPAGSWSDIGDIPVEVRDTDEVTVLPETDGEPATTEDVPAAQDGSAAPIEVSVRPTDDESSLGLIVDIQTQDVISDATEPSPQPSPTATDGPTETPSSEPSASPTESGAPAESPSLTTTESPTAEPTSEPSIDADAAADGEAVQVRVSYTDFRYAIAGDWGARLRVMAYPSCFLTTPDDPACGEGVVVPSVNDPAKETITFTTADLDSPMPVAEEPASADEPTDEPTGEPTDEPTGEPTDGSTVTPSAARVAGSGRVVPAAFTASNSAASTTYVLAASPSGGGAGDFSAMPIQPSASWQVGNGSGDFQYSYPFQLAAPAVAGSTPPLSLDYSSGSVDGLTNSTNGQVPMAGIGWSMDPGYITRSYASCADDGLAGKGDLCWKQGSDGNPIQVLNLVLNGHSSRLVRIGATNRFRLLDDPAWQVDRVYGSDGGTTDPDNPDNDNESFRVRTPDGTEYWFGWDQGSESTWTVPVFGDDAGEPCHSATPAAAWCQQAWRWSLDRVKDSHGNLTTYEYTPETNYYARYGNTANHSRYNRGGYLTGITYGRASATGVARSDVWVESRPRCIQAANDPSAACSPTPQAQPSSWPDVPADLMCDATDTCLNGTPTFFSTRRYEAVNTRRWNAANGMYNVDRYQMTYGFPAPPDPQGNDGIRDLWLHNVVRTGYGSPNVTLPAVVFSGDWMRNRVVANAGQFSFRKKRITSVRTETGGRIDVTYGHAVNKACDATYVGSGSTALAEYGSTRECFPQQLNGVWEWWHKYVVTKVGLSDDALGYGLTHAPTQNQSLGRLRVYDYDYSGTPGWRYRSSPLVPNADQTWDDWRGYATLYIHERSVGPDQVSDNFDLSSRKVMVFRGLDGTWSNNSGAKKTSTVTTSTGGPYADSPWLAGRIAEDATRDGPGTHQTRTNYEYASHKTATALYGYDARYVYQTRKISMPRAGAVPQTLSYTVDDGGTDHTGLLLGAVKQVWENRATPGGNSDPIGVADDLYTCTDWVKNDTTALRVQRSVKVRSGSCTGTTLRQTDYFYDGDTGPTTIPVKGDVTATDNYPEPTEQVRTQYDYDAYGRLEGTSLPYSYNDDTQPVDWSTTARTPANDLVTSVKTTGPAVDSGTPGFATTTQVDPRRGLATSVTDPNGSTTTVERDGLGRPVVVNKPGNDADDHSDSVTYDYGVQVSAPSWVRTTTLRDGGSTSVKETNWSLYDGWGRPIQAQSTNANGDGLVISSTGYDERGLPWLSLPAVFVAGTNGTVGLSVNPANVDHYSVTEYDGAQRPAAVRDMTRGNSNWDTTYTYGINHDLAVTTSPTAPSGTSLATTRTDLDALRRPEKVTQYGNGVSPDPTANRDFDDGYAEYKYTLTGELDTIKTPQSATAGDLVTYNYDYDMLGRRTQATDPDTGTTSYTYDALGNTTVVADAMSATMGTVETSYDVLGRPLLRQRVKDGSPNQDLAKWEYDAANVPNSMGRVTKTTSFTDLGEFTSTVGAYDVRGNPLTATETYPAVLTGEAASGTESKTLEFAYNQLDQVKSTKYPESPDLPELTVNTSYGRNGIFTGMTAGGRTLAGVDYDNVNRPTSLLSEESATDPNRIDRQYGWSDVDRLASLSAVTGPDASAVSQLSFDYTYDTVGNPTVITGTRKDSAQAAPTTAAWCYGYDGISRLTSARTGVKNAAGTGCDDPSVGTDITPVTGTTYSLTYKYAQARLKEVSNGPATATFNYPTGTRPHAANAVTISGSETIVGLPAQGTLAYDSAGRATGWNRIGAPDLNYTYDVQGNLIEANDPATSGVDTVNAFDAGGIRIARKTADETVLYVGGMEITKPTTGAASTRRNFNTPGGTPLATQTSDGDSQTAATWTWLFGDGQDTIRMSKDAQTGTTTHHAYMPFGEPITDPGDLPGERGFLDKPHDPNGSVRLDHRSYDPGLNVLTTPDPLMGPLNPQNLNAYAYAGNNPIAMSDPSGLKGSGPPCLAEGTCDTKPNPAGGAPVPTAPSDPPVSGGSDGGSGGSEGTGSGTGPLAPSPQLPLPVSIHQVPPPNWYVHLSKDEQEDFRDGDCVPLGDRCGVLLGPLVENGYGTVVKVGVKTLGRRLGLGGASAAGGGANAVRLGQAGEDAVRGLYYIGPKQAAQIGPRRRIFDGLTDAAVNEVKNVARQSFTLQLRDSLAYAQSTGRRFDLWVRPGTRLTRPLRDAIVRGDITLRFIP